MSAGEKGGGSSSLEKVTENTLQQLIESFRGAEDKAGEAAATKYLEELARQQGGWDIGMPVIVEAAVTQRNWGVCLYLFFYSWEAKPRSFAAVMHGILGDALGKPPISLLSALLWSEGAGKALRFCLPESEGLTEAERQVYPQKENADNAYFPTPLARICRMVQANGGKTNDPDWFSLALSLVAYFRLGEDELAALKLVFINPCRGMPANKLEALFGWLSAEGTKDKEPVLKTIDKRKMPESDAEKWQMLSVQRGDYASKRKALSAKARKNHDALLLFSMLDFLPDERTNDASIRVTLIDQLLTQGYADPNTCTPEGETALHLLTAQDAPQQRTQRGEETGTLSFGETFKQVLLLLFYHGAFLLPRCPSTNPNAGSKPLPAFETPLHLLMAHPPAFALEIVQAIWEWVSGTYDQKVLRDQADVQHQNFLRYIDFVTSGGETALERLASRKGDNKVLFRQLMSLGADPARRDPAHPEVLLEQCAKKRRPDYFGPASELNSASQFHCAKGNAQQARMAMCRWIIDPQNAAHRLKVASCGEFEMLAWFLQPGYWEQHPDGVELILGWRRNPTGLSSGWVATVGSTDAASGNNIYHYLFTPNQTAERAPEEIDARMQTFLTCLWQIACRLDSNGRDRAGAFLAGIAVPNAAGKSPEALLDKGKYPCTARKLAGLKGRATLTIQCMPFAGDGGVLPG